MKYLIINKIKLSYRGGGTLVEGVSLTTSPGELIGLLGRNGVGKSTLLRTLAGNCPPAAGEVLFCGDGLDGEKGRSVFEMNPVERACEVAFVNTETPQVVHLRVEEVVAMGRAPYTGWLGMLSKEDECVVAEALEWVEMSDFRGRGLESLSDGERQRVMIARALAQDTPFILLDEPTAFLDLPNRYMVVLLLRRLAREAGKTIIFSSHDLSVALELCDTLWVMSPAGIQAGTPTQLIEEGLEAIFEGTPLTLTPEGGVRLRR